MRRLAGFALGRLPYETALFGDAITIRDEIVTLRESGTEPVPLTDEEVERLVSEGREVVDDGNDHRRDADALFTRAVLKHAGRYTSGPVRVSRKALYDAICNEEIALRWGNRVDATVRVLRAAGITVTDEAGE